MKRSPLHEVRPWALALRLTLAAWSGGIIAATSGARVRSRPLNFEHASPTEGFTRLPPERTGIGFTNALPDRLAAKNRILENGSGVAAGDVDGDGKCDLYFCQLDGPNALYINLGNWRFRNATREAGVACAGQNSTGAVLTDIDGDSDLDLLVNGIGTGTRLFLNQGTGRFREPTRDSGLSRKFAAHSMALADVEGDGDLDLYVTNYRTATLKDAPPSTRFQLRRVHGRLAVPPEYRDQLRVMRIGGGLTLVEFGEPDFLYLNRGDGRFDPMSWTDGRFRDEADQALARAYHDWGLAVQFRDINGDLKPDLYVCNDLFSPDRIWINQGKNRFKALAPLKMRKSTWASMAVDFADINRDGLDEFVVVDMLSRRHTHRQTQRGNFELEPDPWWGWPLDIRAIACRPQVMRNTLFLNQGASGYTEIAQLARVHASEWSWGAVFLDVDLDGYEDLLIANGHAHDVNDLDTGVRQTGLAGRLQGPKNGLLMFPRLPATNLAFRNMGHLRFTEVGRLWRFDWKGISNGMALADFDGDGDLDVALNNLNAPAGLFRNDSTAPRIAIRLRGQPPNTRGVGAKIRVSGGPVPQSQEMISGGRYLSGDDYLRTFAAGEPDARLDVEVRWRSGRRTWLTQLKANQAYEVFEPAETDRADSSGGGSPRRAPLDCTPLFEDVSDELRASHHEAMFDDFSRQPLLPRRLSQNGPGIAWTDLNGDGVEDLAVSNGLGASLRVWINQGGKRFVPVSTPALRSVASGEQAGLVGWRTRPGASRLAVALSSYETPSPLEESLRTFDLSFQGIQPAAGADGGPNPGPLALGDLEGDGSLELFVGGQAVPGRYPEATRSQLFRQVGGGWVPDAASSQALESAGLVNGAVWSDLNGDGRLDLVLAEEWGPIRVWLNHRAHLTEATADLGLADFRGWWNGVDTADFDGDGRLDIVASNWGRNTKYEEFLGRGLWLYHGDIDSNGTWDVIEAVHDDGLDALVPLRDFRAIRQAIPSVGARFHAYGKFAAASLEKIFGAALKRMHRVTADHLDSMVFLNRGGRFEARPLPLLAQVTPAFAVVADDFDGDGAEDVFLSQNFFAVDRETGRYDGGRGLLLRGDGRGAFTAIDSAASGIAVFGEQRGAAVADYDRDGRLDLVVTQNAAPVKLFRNQGAAPGIRIRLIGPPGNLDGIGGQIRLKRNGRYGPVRINRAGSGYWSQNGSVQVMAMSPPPSALRVRWPDGKVAEHPIPAKARELEVRYRAGLRVVQ